MLNDSEETSLEKFKKQVSAAAASVTAVKPTTEAPEPMPVPPGFVDMRAVAVEEKAQVVTTTPTQVPTTTPVQVQEPVAVETPVETPVEPSVEPSVEVSTPKVEEHTTTLSAQTIQAIQSSFVNFGRVDAAVSTRFKPISNKGLKDLYSKTNTFSEMVTIPPVLVFDAEGISYSRFGMWEEGGKDRNGVGTALLITDENGNKPSAVRAYHDKHVGNGRHAEVEVREGYYILCYVTNAMGDIGAIYRIYGIVPKQGSNGRTVAEVHASLCYGITDDWVPDTTLVNDHDEQVWHSKHPAIAIAAEQANTSGATEPVYIADYTKYYYDRDDYNVAINAADFQTKQKFDDLDVMYSKVSEIAANTLAANDKTKTVAVTTSLDIVPDPTTGETCIRVFVLCLSCRYTATTDPVTNKKIRHASSENGHLFYGRCILRAGDTFHYVDNPTTVEFTDLVSKVSTSIDPATGNRVPLVAAFKRMTAIN
jgi:hypothetical protein